MPDSGAGSMARQACPAVLSTVALHELAVGVEAVVQEVQAGDPAMDRLMALGVCTGHRVRLIQAGDPLIVQVLGARLGVSARLAARVRVAGLSMEAVQQP